jgi:hypothetical protein
MKIAMPPRALAFVCALAALAASGCAKAQATAAPTMPALAPPDSPTRIVAEYEPDPPLPAEPVAAGTVTPPSRPTRPPRRDAPRPDPLPDESQGPPPAAVAPTPPQALALQTPAAASKADLSIRELLARASRDLSRLDYRTLDADRRMQFDTARGFMEQADDALKARNLPFAGKLADKAATMAAALVR